MAKAVSFRNDVYSWSDIKQVVLSSHQERGVIEVANGLFASTMGSRYQDEPASRMIEKLSRFIETTAEMAKFRQMTYHLEPYIDKVLSINFPRHEGLKLSIYFDQENMEGQEDVEEAVVIHRSAKGLYMQSGTIEDMVVILDEML